MIKIHIGLGLVLLFLLNCEVNAFNVEKYLNGKNYTKGDYTGKILYVNFLKNGYTLEKRPEQHPDELSEAIALPYETYVKAFVVRNNKIKRKINSLNDFEGFVKINTVEKAIEFVRFRTSAQTYFLFRPEVMIEVFKRESKDLGEKWILGGCSPKFFEKHKLKNLEIEAKKEFFEIKRYVVIFPWPGSKEYPSPPSLYRIIEKVFNDGKYSVEKTKFLDGFEFNDIPYPLEPL